MAPNEIYEPLTIIATIMSNFVLDYFFGPGALDPNISVSTSKPVQQKYQILF